VVVTPQRAIWAGVKVGLAASALCVAAVAIHEISVRRRHARNQLLIARARVKSAAAPGDPAAAPDVSRPRGGVVDAAGYGVGAASTGDVPEPPAGGDALYPAVSATAGRVLRPLPPPPDLRIQT
jgi:hypothetical protein